MTWEGNLMDNINRTRTMTKGASLSVTRPRKVKSTKPKRMGMNLGEIGKGL